MGVENYIFWSVVGSGFGELGGTPPPRIPWSTPVPRDTYICFIESPFTELFSGGSTVDQTLHSCLEIQISLLLCMKTFSTLLQRNFVSLCSHVISSIC